MGSGSFDGTTTIVDGTIAFGALDEEGQLSKQNHALRQTIKSLFVDFPEIQACAIISTDGITKSAILGEGMNESRFGAMCASLLSLAQRAAIETSRGDLRLVLIQGEDGVMLIVQIATKGVLAVAAGQKTNLGKVFHAARLTAEKVAEIL